MGDWLLQRLRQPDVVRRGTFTASHGKIVEGAYIDMRAALLADKDVCDLVGIKLAEMLPSDVSFLAIPAGEASGILAAAIRDAYQELTDRALPITQVRKQPKEYGPDAGGHFSGYVFTPREKCVLVDDVFTSGATMLAAYDKLAAAGANILQALTVVSRSDVNFPVERKYIYVLDSLIRE